MRRTVGLIFIGLGAFFLTLSPLVRFYAAKQLVAAPTDSYQKVTLKAGNATYFDTANLKLREGVNLTATNTTRGDVRASSDKIAVWDVFLSINDDSTGTPILYRQTRYAFDRRTAELTNGHGAGVDNDTNIKMSGYGQVFSNQGVEKKTYQVFDGSTKRAWPAVYSGEKKIYGLNTYAFVQKVPPTKISEIAGVPGTLLGLKDKGNVPADRYIEATNTTWVDPRTGAVIKREQDVKQSLHTKDGVERLTVAKFDLVLTDADQKRLVGLADDNANLVGLLKTIVPITALVVGLVLIVVGGYLFISGGNGGGGTRRKRAEIV